MDASKTAASVGNKLQSGEEPVSGKIGKGTAGEPYDQGNAEGMLSYPPIAIYDYVDGLRHNAEYRRTLGSRSFAAFIS